MSIGRAQGLVAAIAFSSLLTLVIACGTTGDSCASSDECASGFYCGGPDEPNACGIPPREECSSNADCTDGSTCHAVGDVCSADGIGSECAPPCTPASCGEGFRCNASNACETIPCDDGALCKVTQRCSPSVSPSTPVHARTSGCQSIACDADAGCPAATSCVNGTCQGGPGSCREDIAVP